MINFLLSIKFLFLIWIILMIILYKKAEKENKVSFKDKYYDVLPGTYTPAEMKVLVNRGKLYSRDIAATITDLIIKNVITVEKESAESILKSKQFDYVLILNKKADIEKLMLHEKFLINWLFTTIGDEQKVTLNSIKDFTRKKETALKFRKDYYEWCRKANECSEKNNFFKKQSINMFSGTFIAIIYLILAAVLAYYHNRIAYAVLLLPSLLTFLYSRYIQKRTEQGQIQFELWMGFKRYIRDLGNSKNDCSLEKCEKFFPYTVSLGVSNQILNYISEKYLDSAFENETLVLFNKLKTDEISSFLNQCLKTFEFTILASDKANSIEKSNRLPTIKKK